MDEISKILPVCQVSGLTTIEITMNTPFAAEIIRSATEQYKGKLNVGAGTVCSVEDLKLALEAGAQFIVTPILNPEVVKLCVKIRGAKPPPPPQEWVCQLACLLCAKRRKKRCGPSPQE